VLVHALAESLSTFLSTIPNVFSPRLHRFFETEGIAILTMLVSQYKISVKEEPQFAHETFEERKERILAYRLGITLTYVVTMMLFYFLSLTMLEQNHSPVRVPLVFTRRK
jgi:hypothetical protein